MSRKSSAPACHLRGASVWLDQMYQILDQMYQIILLIFPKTPVDKCYIRVEIQFSPSELPLYDKLKEHAQAEKKSVNAVVKDMIREL